MYISIFTIAASRVHWHGSDVWPLFSFVVDGMRITI